MQKHYMHRTIIPSILAQSTVLEILMQDLARTFVSDLEKSTKELETYGNGQFERDIGGVCSERLEGQEFHHQTSERSSKTNESHAYHLLPNV